VHEQLRVSWQLHAVKMLAGVGVFCCFCLVTYCVLLMQTCVAAPSCVCAADYFGGGGLRAKEALRRAGTPVFGDVAAPMHLRHVLGHQPSYMLPLGGCVSAMLLLPGSGVCGELRFCM
jgi:hypothetical protein